MQKYLPYETLQACASISVSKLYKFNLPYLVTFVNKLVFWFFPNYSGLQVLTKYFVKNSFFVSWGSPQFWLFYLIFGLILHLQYMKIPIEAFPQSFRYGKYISFATLVTTITVLGAEPFSFPSKKNFAKLQLKKFWAWAETKTGLCWGRITAKALYEFQTNWTFNRETINKTSLLLCRPHNKGDVFV